MANVKFICQRLAEKDNIGKILNSFLKLEGVTEAYISVAFARYDGVESLFQTLQEIGRKLTVFVGIDNGITSVQALDRLMETNARIYTIETANSVVFHPKYYAIENDNIARVVCGSANLTNAGLHSNIEFCTYNTFIKSDPSDASSYTSIKQVLVNLPSNFPNNVKILRENKTLIQLLKNGLIENENIRIEKITQKTNRGPLQSVVMLPATTLSFSHRTPAFTKYIEKKPSETKRTSLASQFKLLWESKALTERDLNIPRGSNTNPTGSMGMKKGNCDVDQRSYFRDIVFKYLEWNDYKARSGALQEEAVATFKIKIFGENRGDFTLRITHDPRKDTESYAQNNMMTHLHWGDAKDIVANRDYLGKFMRLYRSKNDKKYFLLEID